MTPRTPVVPPGMVQRVFYSRMYGKLLQTPANSCKLLQTPATANPPSSSTAGPGSTRSTVPSSPYPRLGAINRSARMDPDLPLTRLLSLRSVLHATSLIFLRYIARSTSIEFPIELLIYYTYGSVTLLLHLYHVCQIVLRICQLQYGTCTSYTPQQGRRNKADDDSKHLERQT